MPYVQYKAFNSFDGKLARILASCLRSWCYTWKMNIHSLIFLYSVHITFFPSRIMNFPPVPSSWTRLKSLPHPFTQYSANYHSSKITALFYAIHKTLYVLAGMFLSWHFLNTDLSSRLRCTRTFFSQCLLLLSHLFSPSSFCFQTVQFGGFSNSDHNAQIHLLFQPRSHTCKTKISLLKTSLYCKIEYTLILYSTALH